jgi:hypothetical protein
MVDSSLRKLEGKRRATEGGKIVEIVIVTRDCVDKLTSVITVSFTNKEPHSTVTYHWTFHWPISVLLSL